MYIWVYFNYNKCNFVESNDSEIPERSTQKEFGRSDTNAIQKSIADKLKQDIEAATKEFEKRHEIFSHHE